MDRRPDRLSISAGLPEGQRQRVPCGTLLRNAHTGLVCCGTMTARDCDQPENAKGPEPWEVSGPACVQ